jgi:hypothetical protein
LGHSRFAWDTKSWHMRHLPGLEIVLEVQDSISYAEPRVLTEPGVPIYKSRSRPVAPSLHFTKAPPRNLERGKDQEKFGGSSSYNPNSVNLHQPPNMQLRIDIPSQPVWTQTPTPLRTTRRRGESIFVESLSTPISGKGENANTFHGVDTRQIPNTRTQPPPPPPPVPSTSMQQQQQQRPHVSGLPPKGLRKLASRFRFR